MKPQKNDFVKLFFKNGVQVEGRIESWGKEIVISSDGSSNYLVVTRPKEIMMYKMINVQAPKTMPTQDVPPPVQQEPTNIEDDNEYVAVEPQESAIDFTKLKTIAELRKLQLKEEKEAIAKKLKDHHIGETKQVEYTTHDKIPGLYEK